MILVFQRVQQVLYPPILTELEQRQGMHYRDPKGHPLLQGIFPFCVVAGLWHLQHTRRAYYRFALDQRARTSQAVIRKK
jgi:hypothetical protein